MDLRIGTAFLFLCCITAIKCWVELDIAGNDLSHPNPQFVKPQDDCDENEQGVGGGQSRYPTGGGGRHRPGKGLSRGGRRRRGKKRRPDFDKRQAFREVNNFALNLEKEKNGSPADSEMDSGPEIKLEGDSDAPEPQQEGDESVPDAPAPQQEGDESEPDASAPQQDFEKSDEPPINLVPDDEQPTEAEDCFPSSKPTVVEKAQKPRLRMIKSKKEKGKEKVVRQTMETTECTEIIDMEPKTSVKIETYTVPYTENVVKYKTMTRRVVYIQRRRKIKRTMNKPVLVIRRKVVKDRQFFERIIPKVIETREVINKPKVDFKIIEGPMEEVGKKPLEKEEDCDELPPPPEAANQAYEGGFQMQMSHSYATSNYNPEPIQDTNGIHVGYDFPSALNDGLSAAFNGDPNEDAVVPPKMRSGSFGGPTPCPPGLVDNGLGPDSGGNQQQAGPGYGQSGSNIYAVQQTNAYGQPVLSFQ